MKLDIKPNIPKKNEMASGSSDTELLLEEALSQIQDVLSDLLQVKDKPPFISFQIPFGLN